MIAGLPYDAEVEYLQMSNVKPSNVQYIDTGKTVSDKTEVEFWFHADQGSSYFIPLFGVYQSDGYLGCQVAYGGAPSNVKAWRGSSTKTSIIDTNTLDQCKGIIELKNGQWGINGTFRSYSSSTFQSTSTAWYGRVNGIDAFGADRKMGYLKIWESGVLVFNAIPVRFTNELGVSEGAMYDRVSRKLFRNSGTGAFTIGPDVATPVMGLHFMRRPKYTAKDYVQTGLVAMWDGIENAGWGMHDAAATTWRNLAQDIWHMPLNSSASWGGIYAYNDGSLCLAKIDSVIPPEEARTIEVVAAWENRTGYPYYGVQCLFLTGGSSGSRLLINESERICGFVQPATQRAVTGFSASEDSPTSLTATYPSTYGVVTDIYKDGVVVTTWSNCNRSPSVGTYIGGGMTGSSAGNVKGKFFSLRVYSKVLTDAEIAANYAVDKERFNLP